MIVFMKLIFATYFIFACALSYGMLLQPCTNLRNTEHDFQVMLVVLSPFIDVDCSFSRFSPFYFRSRVVA